MSNKGKDTQKMKVYKAEEEVAEGKRFYSEKGIQKYIDNIVRSKWFRENYDISHVQIYEQKKALYACAYIPCPKVGAMWIPKNMFRELTILHELAHIVTSSKVQHHGPLYVSNYIKLVKEIMGEKKSEQLIDKFKKYKVRCK